MTRGEAECLTRDSLCAAYREAKHAYDRGDFAQWSTIRETTAECQRRGIDPR